MSIEIIYDEDSFEDKVVRVRQSDIDNACERMIEEMKKCTPVEAWSMGFFDFLLKECRETIRHKKITL